MHQMTVKAEVTLFPDTSWHSTHLSQRHISLLNLFTVAFSHWWHQLDYLLFSAEESLKSSSKWRQFLPEKAVWKSFLLTYINAEWPIQIIRPMKQICWLGGCSNNIRKGKSRSHCLLLILVSINSCTTNIREQIEQQEMKQKHSLSFSVKTFSTAWAEPVT